jgi:tetratricopeptide (TPR) repeat protein
MPDPAAEQLFDEAGGDIAVGDLEAAIGKLREAVGIDPAYFDGWHALGMALFKAGRTREGIGAALMAATLDPNDLLNWTALSQMYVREGLIQEAEEAKGNARILSLGGKVDPSR